MITFTIDLEDHTGEYAPDGRWVANSNRILDFCAASRIKGTFFAVGRASASAPLLKRIVNEGHELALHSYDHILLTKEDPTSYGAKLDAAKKRFEDMTGGRVIGFRAPQFSLVPKSVWAVETLRELGFSYSSSIIPGSGMFQGFPGKPAIPFQWGNGLHEFPVPVLRAGSPAIPYLGGVYLKFLPLGIARAALKQAPPGAVAWTYLHPYDIDDAEGFTRLKDGTPLWANILLMTGRKGFLQKIAALMQGNAGPPLRERI